MANSTSLAQQEPSQDYIRQATRPSRSAPVLDLSAQERQVVLDALDKLDDPGAVNLIAVTRERVANPRSQVGGHDMIMINHALMFSKDPRAPALLQRLREPATGQSP